MTIEDLHATHLSALGIAAERGRTVEKRPVYVTKDGKGKAVESLLAKS